DAEFLCPSLQQLQGRLRQLCYFQSRMNRYSPNDSGVSQSCPLPSPQISVSTPDGSAPEPEPEPGQDNMEAPPHAQKPDQSPPRKRKLDDAHLSQEAE